MVVEIIEYLPSQTSSLYPSHHLIILKPKKKKERALDTMQGI